MTHKDSNILPLLRDEEEIRGITVSSVPPAPSVTVVHKKFNDGERDESAYIGHGLVSRNDWWWSSVKNVRGHKRSSFLCHSLFPCIYWLSVYIKESFIGCKLRILQVQFTKGFSLVAWSFVRAKRLNTRRCRQGTNNIQRQLLRLFTIQLNSGDSNGS